MERWSGRVALVTGATSGIGASIAVELAKNGMKVVGCGRRVEKIQELNKEHGVRIIEYKCDLSNMSEIYAMFDWIKAHKDLGHLDACICNAGMSTSQTLMEGNPESWNRMMNVNVISTSLATQLAIKQFKEFNINDGQIIMINSVFSHNHPSLSMEYLNFYSATKITNKALLEMWRKEISLMEPANNIRIAAISPGLVDTEFIPAMYKDKSPQELEALKETVRTTMTSLTPQEVVNTLLYIMSTPPHIQIHDVIIRTAGKNNI
uniref:Dehydrogenase/reductase SDR family member 11like [Strongylocentrotus purpuratus] n=1 Tax=Lepeophtheirus salmonis TaxID=72036 RepID=A0A0K2UHW2_LEPSM